MSIESAAPPSAPAVYRTLIVAGAIAAIVAAVTIGIMVFNVVTRPELHDPDPVPVPVEDAGHAQALTWAARI